MAGKVEDQDTHSSFKKANDHLSVLSAMLSARSSSPFSNDVGCESKLILRSHLTANSLRRLCVGKLYVNLVSKREGRLRMASSISSGWFVLAMVRMPSFWA